MRNPSEVILLALKLTYADDYYDVERHAHMCLAIDSLADSDDITKGEAEATKEVVMAEVDRISKGATTMRSALTRAGLSTADMVGFYKKFAEDLRKSEM